MIIDKIKFKNFMAYYGESEFEFSVKNGKNVSIIYAPNDVGKSCFFKGILYAMYGTERNESEYDLLNRNALNEGDYEGYVYIKGIHNEKIVEITRIIKPLRDSKNPSKNDFNSTLIVRVDNKVLPWDEQNDFINSIIPKDASKYFFFDGEKIKTYALARSSEYKEAIIKILGIKEIENAKDDFIRLEREYKDEYDKIMSKNEEAERIIKDKNEIKLKIEKLKEDLHTVNNEIKECENRKNSLEEELKKYEYVKKRIEKKQKLEKKLNKLEMELNNKKERKKHLFIESGTLILGCVLLDELEKEEGMDESIPQININNNKFKEFLKELMYKEKCVCGTPITEKEKNYIEEYLKQLDSIEDESKIKSEIYLAYKNAKKYYNDGIKSRVEYIDIVQEIANTQKEYYHIQSELYDLKKKIGGYNEEDVKNISIELERTEKRLDELKNKKGNLQGKIELYEKELKKKENELKKFEGFDGEVEKINKKLEVCTKIKKIFSEFLEEMTKRKKEEVQKNATNIFLNLTNKPNKYKELIITDDYELKLRLTDGTELSLKQENLLNPSTGQSKIISLAYIAGINKSSNAIAPIVIDNPVGLFSEEHKKNIVKYIPRFGEQVILMATCEDLDNKYKSMLKPYINYEYYLEDISKEDGTTHNKTKIVDVRKYV
jgi:DNA sulfur modification protein DndD